MHISCCMLYVQNIQNLKKHRLLLRPYGYVSKGVNRESAASEFFFKNLSKENYLVLTSI